MSEEEIEITPLQIVNAINNLFLEKDDLFVKLERSKKENERLNSELQDFKVQDITNQEQLYDLIEENERLNNIINELEKWLKDKIDYIVNYIDKSKVKPYGEELKLLENCANRYNDILEKLKELKGSDTNAKN